MEGLNFKDIPAMQMTTWVKEEASNKELGFHKISSCLKENSKKEALMLETISIIQCSMSKKSNQREN